MKDFIALLFVALLPTALFAQQCHYGEALSRFQEKLPDEKIYVHTDQSYYEPGQMIWFKVYVLDEKLAASKQSMVVNAELIDPRGNSVKKLQLQNIDGSCHGDFELASSAAGGQYLLKVSTRWQLNMSQELRFEKKITVQKSLIPNVLMEFDFLREQYGAGSSVESKLTLRSKDNKALAEQRFEYTLRLAGKKYWTRNGKTNAKGQVLIEFQLPEDLNTADALLNISLNYQGNTEAISRAIPIVTKKVDLKFLPEGGHVVLSQKQILAFKALDEFGKPCDLSAVVYDNEQNKVADFRSFHQGMGAFQWEPMPGKTYTAKITEPSGLRGLSFSLPKAEASGTLLQVGAKTADNLSLRVYSPTAQSLCVVLQMQNSVQEEIGIAAKAGWNDLNIACQKLPMGIAQITLFDAQQIPQAERLVFVNKQRQIKVEVKTDHEKYQIRDSVWVDISVTDESGKGLSGDFSMAVVDDKHWTFADDKQANILAKMLLCSDLKGEVFEPNFYFDADETKADSALDYVMLTHGWRSFEWRKLLSLHEADWASLVRFEPEPSNSISGSIHFLGKPLANHRIRIKPALGYRGNISKTIFHSDKEGRFSLSGLEANIPFLLCSTRGTATTECGPFNLKEAASNKMHNVSAYRNSGVEFNDVVSNSNTFFPAHINPYLTIDKNSSYRHLASGSYVANEECSGICGALQGKVTDEMGEPLAFANVTLYRGDALIRGTSCDFDGLYNFSNVTPGIYDVELSYVGYPSKKTTGVLIKVHQTTSYNISYTEEELMLGLDEEIEAVIVTSYRIPLIEVGSTTGGRTLGSEDIRYMPTRNVNTLIATTPEVSQRDEGERINNNGSRSSSDDVFVDGVRMVYANVDFSDPEPKRLKVNKRNTQEGTIGGKLPPTPVEKVYLPYRPRIVGFSIDNVAKVSFYKARSFYAPDYTRYLSARKDGARAIRSDFRNTVFWQPYVKTDKNGKARILFFNSDAVSTFRIIVEGVAAGKVGRAEHTYSVQMPFEIEVKMPKVLTVGDTLRLPLHFRNLTADTLSGTLVISNSCGLKALYADSILQNYRIMPNSHQTLELNFLATIGNRGNFSIYFPAAGFEERQSHALLVQDKGFPRNVTLSDNNPNQKVVLTITDPELNSIAARFEIFANPMQSFFAALQGIIRQPHGCFEQVSSSNYPNVLALQLMKKEEKIKPDLWSRAQAYLDEGYKKLAAYECKGGGFDWFGKSPAHESLTAYGLMEFKDMTQVYEGVDQAMVERAKTWLLSRRNGKGGFDISEVHYGWGSSVLAANAYITYCLAYIGEKGIAKELKACSEEAKNTKDLYRLGLMCLAHFEIGNVTEGELLWKIIREEMQKQGLDKLSADQDVTYSKGISLKSTLLSFAVLCNAKRKQIDLVFMEQCMTELMKYRSGGTFGGTQSTIWALKAIMAYRINIDKKEMKGSLDLVINGKNLGPLAISNHASSNLRLDTLGKYLQKGENQIEIRLTGINALPYSLDINWKTLTPENDSKNTICIRTALDRRESVVGETVRMDIVLENKDSASTAPSPMAVVGIPAGLGLQAWQLQSWLDEHKVDFYEIHEDKLVLYFRSFQAMERRHLYLDLKAELPGTFLAAASNAYLYYYPESKDWVAGELIRVASQQ